ncbi:hypothetical protein LCGC14_3005210, partial [marine sediment metagenome]
GTMFEVDVSDGVATEVGTLSGGHIGGVFVGDPPPGASVAFQQDVAGYYGTVDTFLQENLPSADNSLAAELSVDGDDPGGTGLDSQILLRFDDIFGDGPGQIPTGPGVTINWALLELMATNAGDGGALHRMLQPWTDSDTWDLLGNGVQANGVEALLTADLVAGENVGVPLNLSSFDVTASLQAWLAAPESNRGWALLPIGSNGWDFYSAEGATPPRLIVNYVPEPGTLAMLLAGSAGLLVYGWGRRKRLAVLTRFESDVRTMFRLTVVAVVLGLFVGVGHAEVVMETVPVGDPGNVDDVYGFGRVDYTYRIGKYEVTAGQYSDFLNAVAATDPHGLYNSNMDSDSWGWSCRITQNNASGSYTY